MQFIVSTISLCISACFPSIAQKNRAVFQDVGTLLNIMNRDYYSIEDPEIRLNEIQKDRATVVSIFKGYTANFTNPTTAYQTDITGYQRDIKQIRQKISAWSVSPQNVASDLLTKQANLVTLSNELNTKLDDLEKKLWQRDKEMLNKLSAYFSSVNGQNVSLQKMIDKFILKFGNIFSGNPDQFASNIEMPQLKKSLGLFSTGTLTVTQVIDGLSTFMAKRIKEELAMQIFDKIKKELSENNPVNDKFLELKILLPRTTTLLQTISPEQYPGVINSLKEVIEADLNNVMVNIPGLIKSSKVQKLINKNPEIELAFLGLQLIQDINRVKTPIEIIFLIESSELVMRWGEQDRHKNFVNGIRFASLVIYSLTEDTSDTRHLVSRDTWISLYKTPEFYSLFIGFLIQQDKKYYNITLGGTELNNLLKDGTKVVDWYTAFSPKITDLLDQASGIESQLNELKKLKADGHKLSYDSVAQTLKSSITFLDSAISITDFAFERLGKPGHVRMKSRMYFTFARVAVDIYADLGSKRYYNAISKAVDIASLVETEAVAKKSEQLRFIISEIRKIDALHLDLSKEINSGKITSSTLERLKTISKELKISCRACSDFDTVIGMAGDIVSQEGIANVSTLKSFLLSSTAVPYFMDFYKRAFEKFLQLNGLEDFPLPSPDTTPPTLIDYRNFLLNNFSAFLLVVNPNPDVLRVINFIVAVSKAEDAESLAKAIEAIALPPGSALIKREAAFNISLNGYAGFYGGVERIYETNSNAGAIAFTVPIGIAISKSFGKPCEGSLNSCRQSGSWTIFLSAIDIGAFTSVRFKDGDQTLPEIKFKNIFAPGIQFIYGIPKSSFSIAAGAQLGPFLRKVEGPVTTTTTNTTNTTIDPINPNTTIVTTTSTSQSTAVLNEKPAIRFGVSLLLDIPLVNFFTKSKGYKR